MFDLKESKIAVVGLGYVGLPVAVEFGKLFHVIGFDVDFDRIQELQKNIDKTKEIDSKGFKEATNLIFTNETNYLKDVDIYIITVPTPIDEGCQPDLTFLKKASAIVGDCLSSDNIVIYESTVYPGATEEVCVPILEKYSGMTFNLEFFVGYSPERINPGDKKHTIANIKKVTSGSTPEAADLIDSLYGLVIKAGTHKASSIKVAEAAKVIENTQRDLNIALINELAIIFERLGIDTQAVLEAAKTKWNFLPFVPGLVGGHCIGVDPYYLTYKSQAVGYHPEVILAGRKINDGMGAYVALQVVKHMIKSKIHVLNSNVLILGFTFKENCPDVRNTRVIDIVQEIEEYGAKIHVYDPWVDAEVVRKEYDIDMCSELKSHSYDAIVLAVAHEQFQKFDPEFLTTLGKPNYIIYDIKSMLPFEVANGRL